MSEGNRRHSEEVALLLGKVADLERENELNKLTCEDSFRESILTIKRSRTWVIGTIFVLPFAIFREFLKNPIRFCQALRKNCISLFNQHIPTVAQPARGAAGNSGRTGSDSNIALPSDPGDEASNTRSDFAASLSGTNIKGSSSLKGKRAVKSMRKMTIAAVVDEFTSSCLAEDVRLLHLTPENWEEVFGNNEIDLVFVESAWSGCDKSWEGIMPYAHRVENAEILRQLNAYAGKNNVPTVFWSKEDPPDYEVFKNAASFFDYIFTSDANMIPRYSRDLRRSQVYELPFAAQPALHNPIGKTEEPGKDLLFAGTWYKRHKDRFLDYERVLEPALNFSGFHIYDRMFNNPDNSLYGFPEKYDPFIKGELPYASLLEEYKKYKIFLNVNSVQYSPTMFSRRVFEVLLSGTPVISGYSLGIEKLLGGETVQMVSTPEEGMEAIASLLESKEKRHSLSRSGIRRVMEGNTYRDRLRYVFDTVGIEHTRDFADVAVWALVRNRQELDNVLDNFFRQSFKRGRLSLYLVTPDMSLTSTIHLPVRTKVLPLEAGSDVPEALDLVFRNSSEPCLAYLDPNVCYGPFYLMDMEHALRYSRCKLVVKSGFVFLDEGRLLLKNERERDQYLTGVECDVSSAVYYRSVPVELRKLGRHWKITGKGLRMYSHDSQGLIKGKNAARLTSSEVEALGKLGNWMG
jgi:spore maturation protein CgeB